MLRERTHKPVPMYSHTYSWGEGEGRYNSAKYIQLICNGYIYIYFTAKKIQLKINDFGTNLIETNEQFVLNRKGKTCPFFTGIWKMDS